MITSTSRETELEEARDEFNVLTTHGVKTYYSKGSQSKVVWNITEQGVIKVYSEPVEPKDSYIARQRNRTFLGALNSSFWLEV